MFKMSLSLASGEGIASCRYALRWGCCFMRLCRFMGIV